ncbi:MAG TPA: hypothetical protein PLA30_03295, partial [Smithellaceae bacterium]|nr:hypothetical protein [Smithellaceae bacterium]
MGNVSYGRQARDLGPVESEEFFLFAIYTRRFLQFTIHYSPSTTSAVSFFLLPGERSARRGDNRS